MHQVPFGLLELGSNSLKFYLIDDPTGPAPSIETHKIPWRVAHDFFSNGSVSEATILELINALKTIERIARSIPLRSMLAIATGVFREIDSMDVIAARVKAETGVRIRIISGEDEAKLMAREFTPRALGDDVLLFDLGGATTQWAWFKTGSTQACGSLPLGAIRLEYAFKPNREDADAYLRRSAAHCDNILGKLPMAEPLKVVGTGGTIKAVANCVGRDIVSRDEIQSMIARVLREGPPPSLKPSRQAVFLPGLVILSRIVERCRAAEAHYGKASVRDGMAARLIRLLGSHRREDLHATLLLTSRDLHRAH